ncbi:flagellar biosynthesis protein FlhF [uncultured Brevibacillus sp.]|uniref:flagellar biosynthesis protein FlhF n=1 Tax=uncultured Brevibacillus sp. TaxID=169970 RepID=UPI0025915432|nr:flagellar biosynthesis protein FlhF [uncultured Brevibacillus sp.]
MRVKRYIVDTMPEAMEKIRTDLGMDAVILNSKPFKSGGFFGMFSKQQIEVIAAVDEKGSQREDISFTANDRQKDVSSRQQTGTYTAQQAYRRPTVPRPPADKPISETKEQEPLSEQPIALAQANQLVQEETAVATEQPITKQRAAAVVPLKEEAQPIGQNEVLANEIRGMRQMFQKLLVNDLSHQLPQAIQDVRKRLVDQEVTEELTAQIIRQLMESQVAGKEWSNEEAYVACRQIISELVKPRSQGSAKLDRSVEYAFFFGPTGVGKTTTIAKLAANSMLKEKRKIGFITADTYRMAAVEQLKTYANILNVPMEVVFSPKEMKQAMERLSDCDLIFVDTAGRNFRNDEYVQGIRELVEQGTNSMNYLVLSLSTKYNDMKAIIDNFGNVPVKHVIFTKVDETQSFGSIVNVCQNTNLELSYVTTGQNVPDDIALATPEMVAAMILGE